MRFKAHQYRVHLVVRRVVSEDGVRHWEKEGQVFDFDADGRMGIRKEINRILKELS